MLTEMSSGMRGYWHICIGGFGVLVGIFFFMAFFGIAGSTGDWVFSLVNGVGGDVGVCFGAFLLIVLGVLVFRHQSLPYLWLVGAILSWFSLVVFSTVSFGDDVGGYIGQVIAEWMNSMFSTFSFLLLPVLFIVGLWLTGLFPVELMRRIRNRYMEWREECAEARALEEEEGEEEYEEEGEEEYDDEDDEYEEEEEEEIVKEKKIGTASASTGAKTKKNGIAKRIRSIGSGMLHSGNTVKHDAEYTFPALSLLTATSASKMKGGVNTKEMARGIERTFQTFGIPIHVEEVDVGPTVSRFAVKPAEGVRLSKIIGLQSNLELALAAHPIRIEAPIPGRSLVGIEVPNTSRGIVGLRDLLEDPDWNPDGMTLPVAIGRTVTGALLSCDIGALPHLLIAGTTGSGKSVLVHNILMSLIYTRSPKDVRFILIDPKRVELSLYDGIPHLYTSVITDPKAAVRALGWAVNEMERRYSILEEWRVRDLNSYGKMRAKWLKKEEAKGGAKKADADDESSFINDDEHKGEESEEERERGMPEISSLVIVVDELSDLMQVQPRELEASIVRLAQKSRAVGIHLILSTQRPSVNVITGLVKANIPARVALRVPSQVDARTILDTIGAETLLGHGDLLIRVSDAKKPQRAQGAFVSEDDVKKVVDAVISAHGRAIIDPTITGGSGNRNASGSGTPRASKSNTGTGTTAPTNMESIENIMENGIEEDDDALYADARETVISAQKASTSLLQRKLKIGYSRAARLMDTLEERGVIGVQSGSKPREVLEQSEDDGRNSNGKFPE